MTQSPLDPILVHELKRAMADGLSLEQFQARYEEESLLLARRVFLGGVVGVQGLKGPPEMERRRDEMIIEIGRIVARRLTDQDVRWHQPLRTGHQSEVDSALRIKERDINLGTAWTVMRLNGEYSLRALQREYRKRVADPPTISQQLNQKVYERRAYAKKRAAQIDHKDERLGEDLRQCLLELVGQPSPDPEQLLTEKEAAETLRGALASELTPGEKRGLESILSDEPPTDAADRQRRCRARKRLRSTLSQDDRFSRLLRAHCRMSFR
jgi:hypothetical protein